MCHIWKECAGFVLASFLWHDSGDLKRTNVFWHSFAKLNLTIKPLA